MYAQWEFMAAWCAPLRGKLSLQIDSCTRVPSSHCAGIKVRVLQQAADASPSAVHAVRDALVLLSLVARVDARAWAFVLHEHCGLRLSARERVLAVRGLLRGGFILVLDERAAGCEPARLGAALWCFFMQASVPTSSQFAATAQFIALQARHRPSALSHVDIPVRLSVVGGDAGPRPLAQRVRSVLKRLRFPSGSQQRFPVWMPPRIWGRGRRTIPAIGCALVLKPSDIHHTRLPLQADATHALASVVAGSPERRSCSSVAINGFLDHQVCDRDPAGAAQILGSAFERLLCASDRPAKEPRPIKRVAINCAFDDQATITRLCTAIAVARTTSSICLTFEEAEDEADTDTWTWAMLAYALFSKQRRSSIRTVELECASISSMGAEAVAAVLASQTTNSSMLELLGFQASDEDCSLVRVTVKKGAVVKLPPDDMEVDGGGSRSFVLQNNVVGTIPVFPHDLRVDTPDISVILPGYGVCSVAKHQLTPFRSNKMSRTSEVTSLAMSFVSGFEAVEGLPHLLELVGAQLKHLRLGMSFNGHGPLTISGLMASCRQLQTLIIEGQQLSASSFLAAYKRNNMQLAELSCWFDDIGQITKELSDNASPLARTLTSVDLTNPWGCCEDEQQVKGLIAMLESNRKLEYLGIKVSRSIHKKYWMDFAKHQHEALPLVRRPFPLNCRLAFLSVFGSNAKFAHDRFKKQVRFGSSVSVLSGGSIDLPIFSTIFAYAADCVHRHIDIETVSTCENE